jgi:hypothetical protein
MKQLASAGSRGEVIPRGWRSGTANKALLVAGIAAVGVYGLGDLLSGLLYDGYSFKDQWISELTAFGSPVRPLMVAAILVHGLLLVAFGVGVWRSADRRSLRWVGLLLVAAGLVGVPNHTVFARHPGHRGEPHAVGRGVRAHQRLRLLRVVGGAGGDRDAPLPQPGPTREGRGGGGPDQSAIDRGERLTKNLDEARP